MVTWRCCSRHAVNNSPLAARLCLEHGLQPYAVFETWRTVARHAYIEVTSTFTPHAVLAEYGRELDFLLRHLAKSLLLE